MDIQTTAEAMRLGTLAPKTARLGSRRALPLPTTIGVKTGHKLRICIVTSHIAGPAKTSGLGTAYMALAELVAAAGHDVTIVYLRGERSDQFSITYWIAHYAAQNIRLVPLGANDAIDPACPYYLRRPYETCLWLKTRLFDLIHYADCYGVGYHLAQAKHRGEAFQSTLLCAGAHGSTLWLESLGALYSSADERRAHFHMEAQSLTLADIVISPSHYMVDWLRGRGIDLPEATYVQPNILPAAVASGNRAVSGPVRELVFFGRLEFRKGLALFCDACDQLSAADVGEGRITFLGNPVKTPQGSTDTYIESRARQWPFSWHMIKDKGHAEAQLYLQQAGVLAVVPSLGENSPYTVLECLGAGVPVIASDVGGIPELIAAADVARICFPPEATALADKMRLAFRQGIKPGHTAIAVEANRLAWRKWHNGLC